MKAKTLAMQEKWKALIATARDRDPAPGQP
jgi:hypothetical protein